jgi:hypothetical protein
MATAIVDAESSVRAVGVRGGRRALAHRRHARHAADQLDGVQWRALSLAARQAALRLGQQLGARHAARQAAVFEKIFEPHVSALNGRQHRLLLHRFGVQTHERLGRQRLRAAKLLAHERHDSVGHEQAGARCCTARRATSTVAPLSPTSNSSAHRLLGARSTAAHVRRSVDAVHRGVCGGERSAVVREVRVERGAKDATLRRKMQVARHREHRQRPPPRQRVAASRLIDVRTLTRHAKSASQR